MFDTTMQVDAVKNGASYFDAKKPDWALEINVEKLDLSSGSQCIIGQLYGQYDRKNLVELGLTDVDFRNSIGITCYYGGYEKHWIDEIYARWEVA
jgi:hypothetical protein